MENIQLRLTMKKITFVIGVMGKGGAERVIANLSNYFVKFGWKIDVIMIYGSRQDYELNPQITLHPILCKNKIRFFRPFERIKVLREKIKSLSPDLVISFLADVNIYTIISLVGLHQKLVVSERNDPAQDPEQRWMRYLRNNLYKKIDGIVFQTPDAKAYFDDIIPANIPTVIIANPLMEDLPFYDKTTRSTTFITACRLNSQKNLPMMINAVGNLIKEGLCCNLEIYGEGILHNELQNYIDSKNLSRLVKLCGFSKNIHEIMSTAVGFVISSNYEGISNSMLEALAIGIPVVATDCPVGGAKMYIEDDTRGYLVACNDEIGFTNAMREVLLKRDIAIAKGEKASVIRDVLTIEKISTDWKSFILTVLS